MIISFECKTCKKEFDCEVGKIMLPKNATEPVFERDIVCPDCGKLSKDDVVLTERGNARLYEATWGV